MLFTSKRNTDSNGIKRMAQITNTHAFTLIFFFLSFLISHAQFKTSYFDNGKIKSEGCYSKKDTLKQGPWRLYYNTGKLNAEGSFFNGKMHGEWKYYNFSTASLEKIEQWNMGVQQGEMREFYPNGKLYRSFQFVNGVYEGASVAFHPNGKLKTKGMYKAGMPEGAWENFDENGNPIIEKLEEPQKEEKETKRKRKKRKRE